MTAAELDKILKSKHAMRSRLASLPICEKLRILDELRERAMTISVSRAKALAQRGDK